MAITYELLETFTGSRTTEMPSPSVEGETISATADCLDILVRFTDSESSKTHERSVNVVFDENGDYDSNATAVRIEEVALGVAEKIKLGIIG